MGTSKTVSYSFLPSTSLASLVPSTSTPSASPAYPSYGVLTPPSSTSVISMLPSILSCYTTGIYASNEKHPRFAPTLTVSPTAFPPLSTPHLTPSSSATSLRYPLLIASNAKKDHTPTQSSSGPSAYSLPSILPSHASSAELLPSTYAQPLLPSLSPIVSATSSPLNAQALTAKLSSGTVLPLSVPLSPIVSSSAGYMTPYITPNPQRLRTRHAKMCFPLVSPLQVLRHANHVKWFSTMGSVNLHARFGIQSKWLAASRR